MRSDGTVVGTLAEQTRQALLNMEAALADPGATMHNVVRWTIAIMDGHPPAISVHIVSGLASPRYLVEINAVAVV